MRRKGIKKKELYLYILILDFHINYNDSNTNGVTENTDRYHLDRRMHNKIITDKLIWSQYEVRCLIYLNAGRVIQLA